MHPRLRALVASFVVIFVSRVAGADSVRPAELKLQARLVWRPPAIGCGILYVVDPMEYEVESVERGRWPGKRIVVFHSCPDIPRSGRQGNLREFRVGDVHRLILTRVPPKESERGGVDHFVTSLPRFWPLRVDFAAP
jgi:hypothetical protein